MLGKLLQSIFGNRVTTIAGIGVLVAAVGQLMQGETPNLQLVLAALAGFGLLGARDGGTGSDTP
jgi:hypothetical protein